VAIEGNLKAQIGSEIIAAPDKALKTKCHATKILKTETDSKCRQCQQYEETIDHVRSACPVLVKEQYIF
jgi:hypothetical protein